MHGTIVETNAGRLRGRITDGVVAFKGVPYGEQVSRRRRWLRSSPVTGWRGVRDAGELGPRAIQPESRDMHTTSPDIESLMLAGAPAGDDWRHQDEECLTLSVWAPEGAAQRRLPVMVWCHGGKYFGETPHPWWFDGQNLARSGDVVVVTVRHRVGALGFLHLGHLPGGERFPDSANVGMLDLVDSLRWVRENIGAFGGDPANVTVFGESGGGLKVSVLLQMPEAKGLFHRAIIQSGSQTEAGDLGEGAERTRRLVTELGLEDDQLDRLLDVPTKDLVEAQIRLAPPGFLRPPGGRFAEFEPLVDGRVLAEGCFARSREGAGHDVPVLVGTCADETSWFLAGDPEIAAITRPRLEEMLGRMLGARRDAVLGTYRADGALSPVDTLVAITSDMIFRRNAIRLAENRADHCDSAVYMYVLSYATDICEGRYRTPHTLDIPLVFGHPDHPFLGTDPARFVLSRRMIEAWTTFARTGDPNTAALPVWPVYDRAGRATMEFAERPRVLFDPRPRERVLWS